MANSGRSAGIPRNRHLLGETWGGFRASLIIGRLRRAAGSPENPGRPRIRPSARSSPEGRDLWPIQDGRPKFREIAT